MSASSDHVNLGPYNNSNFPPRNNVNNFDPANRDNVKETEHNPRDVKDSLIGRNDQK